VAAMAHACRRGVGVQASAAQVGLYRIFFDVEAFVHESVILLSPLRPPALPKIFFHVEAFVQELIILVSPPPPTCIAHIIVILVHDYCAKYDPPPATSLLYEQGTPPPHTHTAADTAHSAHRTQPALRPHRAMSYTIHRPVAHH